LLIADAEMVACLFVEGGEEEQKKNVKGSKGTY
jgi:hypothetical protein